MLTEAATGLLAHVRGEGVGLALAAGAVQLIFGVRALLHTVAAEHGGDALAVGAAQERVRLALGALLLVLAVAAVAEA